MSRADERAVRGLEEQRRRHAQFAAMMNELSSDDDASDSEEDGPIRGGGSRPTRGGGLAIGLPVAPKQYAGSTPLSARGTPSTVSSYGSSRPSPAVKKFESEFRATSASMVAEEKKEESGKSGKASKKDYHVVANVEGGRAMVHRPPPPGVIEEVCCDLHRLCVLLLPFLTHHLACPVLCDSEEGLPEEHPLPLVS